MDPFEQDLQATRLYFESPRFKGIRRLYSARQVVEQRGVIAQDYSVAREAAEGFHARLRELFAAGRSITTFGPYSPSQAVTMKRMGIEGIYLGGWATSAKGSIQEDPGADLASYPLSQVPDEASAIVRALSTADRNQTYQRSRLSAADLASAPRTGRLPTVHHRRRRHGSRRRCRRAEPHPPVRRGRGHRLSHRGPAPRHQEVRPPRRQGSRRRGRTDQAPQRRSLPTRHHAGTRHHRGPHRCRGREPPRQQRRRAGPPLHPRGDPRRHPVLQTDDAGPDARLLSTQESHIFNGFTLYKVTDKEYAAADAWLDRTGIAALARAAAKETAGAGASPSSSSLRQGRQ